MPTKIMYLADRYEGPQAGTEGQLLQLVQHLDRTRYEPAITLLRRSDYALSGNPESNPFSCPVDILDVTRLASIRSIIKVIRFALKIRRENYRLVHCFFNDVSLIAPPLLWMCGIRVIVSRRDMGFWYTPWNLAVLRLVSPFVDHYVANCAAIKRVVERMERVSTAKITVIYNGYAPRVTKAGAADQATAVLRSIPDNVPVVGIVANLRPIKRIDTLLLAFVEVRRRYPAARLVIVGADGLSQTGGDMRRELQDFANGLGIGEHILFTGRVDDPAPYIQRFDVAVLSSESEGFSNSVIEYMQAGRPSICTDTGGTPELVRDGHNGFLIRAGDADSLANRVITLLSNSALARQLGETARETIAANYSHKRMVTEQMACYDKLLPGGWLNWWFMGASGDCAKKLNK